MKYLYLHPFQGYVQIDEFFTRDELDPVREAIAVLVDQLAEKLYKAGRIKSNVNLMCTACSTFV